MTDPAASNTTSSMDYTANAPVIGFEESQQRVGQLLADLQDSTPAAESSQTERAGARFENQLAMVRLGMATSLFYALRTKHAPTAAHSLRVALSCSAWAERMGLDEATRDRIEVASLLHDLGKIGIPDRILRKPRKLTPDEQLIMDCCPQLGCEILRGCTGDIELLDIVQHANRWYDSRRHEDGPRGEALPLGSRMLSIANAFDAMTTDSVYRPALSRERAIHELLDGSCTQFDPDLAVDFHRMLEDRPELLHGGVVNRWLQQLQPDSDTYWSAPTQFGQPETTRTESLFYQQLIGNMKDGVVFTDAEGTITEWNIVMRRLTGHAADAVVGQAWSDQQAGLRDHDGGEVQSDLIRECLASGTTVASPMTICIEGKPSIPVQVQVSPVPGAIPGIHGTVMIVRDLSDQADMEEQIETLHIQSTLDPLTRLSNRAHFDQVLADLNLKTTAGGPTFSLIICDIDHFKRVNDVHGHPAGDEALVCFAEVLNGHSREGDLVARYGGEEFLLLTPNCDNATAANRAEAIRHSLEMTPLPSLNGESVTASFGVTEFQIGDTPETVLARADRALLKAKDNGRNRVIQLGSGVPTDVSRANPAKRSWLNWFDWDEDSETPANQEFDIATPVPVDLAIMKLRGFIADHNAEIICVNEDQVSLKLNVIYTQGGRRRVDQQIALRADMTLSERRANEGVKLQKTNIHVILEPIRSRDRRSRELSACCAQVVASLNSYLMGEMVHDEEV
ncbi:MAG: diguanylate cyclase [Rubripirellula sp.]